MGTQRIFPHPQILYTPSVRGTDEVHDSVHVEKKPNVYWYMRGVNPTGLYTRSFTVSLTPTLKLTSLVSRFTETLEREPLASWPDNLVT